MLKKTITFKDLDGQDVTEDFYFNLSAVELAEMEIGNSNISDRLKKIIESEDTGQIFQMFKEILTKAVGKRSDDGRRFVKNQDVVDEFFQSNAYEVLFFEWIADGNAAAEFINGLMPADLEQVVSGLATNQKVTDVQLPEQPAWITEDRDPTSAELQSMTQAQLKDAFVRKAEREKNVERN